MSSVIAFSGFVSGIAVSGIIVSGFVYSPLDHGDYPSDCACWICAEARVRLLAFQAADHARNTHERSCSCALCRSYMRARSSHLASNNRRDLYGECSWHASLMDSPDVGKRLMIWVEEILSDRDTYTDGWWEGRMPYFPVAFWLTLFKRDVGAGIDRKLAELDELLLGELPKTVVGEYTYAAAVSGHA